MMSQAIVHGCGRHINTCSLLSYDFKADGLRLLLLLSPFLPCADRGERDCAVGCAAKEVHVNACVVGASP